VLVVVVSRAVEVPVEASVSPEVVFELVFVAVDVAVVAVVCAVRVSVPVVVVRVIVVVVVWVDTGGATPLSVEGASEVLPSTLVALSFEDGERSTPPSQPCASVFVVEAVPPLPAAPASAVPAAPAPAVPAAPPPPTGTIIPPWPSRARSWLESNVQPASADARPHAARNVVFIVSTSHVR